MKLKHFATAAMLSGLMVVGAHAASAAELIQGSVYFGAGTPASDFTAPDGQVQFSFVVPNPLDANPTSSISDFSYELNGKTVTESPTAVQFFSASSEGMFDIDFGGTEVSIYGADIGSSGVVGPTGGYTVTAALDDGGATGNGFVTLGPIGVPEPSTWAMMLVGIAGVGASMRMARRQQRVLA